MADCRIDFSALLEMTREVRLVALEMTRGVGSAALEMTFLIDLSVALEMTGAGISFTVYSGMSVSRISLSLYGL